MPGPVSGTKKLIMIRNISGNTRVKNAATTDLKKMRVCNAVSDISRRALPGTGIHQTQVCLFQARQRQEVSCRGDVAP